MSTIASTPINSTIFQKYAVAIFQLLLIGGGGLAALLVALSAPTGTVYSRTTAVLAFVVLIAGGVLTYIVGILPAGWRGAAKVGFGVLATVITVLIPFIRGDFNPVTDVPLMVVGLLNALAVQLGVTIRTDGPEHRA